MNQKYFDIVFQGLNDHIIMHSEIKAKVIDRPNTEIYPKIVVSEITNISTLNLGRMESYSLLGYEIGIYAKNTTINGKAMDAMDIARYLQGVVTDYMDYDLHMKRAMADYKDNIDNSLYCIIMRYNAKGSDYRSRFF